MAGPSKNNIEIAEDDCELLEDDEYRFLIRRTLELSEEQD